MVTKTLLAIVLLVATSSSAALSLPILGVIDGDTIRTSLPLPCPLCNAAVRISGIDTPESSTRFAKCSTEIALGIKAKAAVVALIGSSTHMEVSRYSWDKYGGRLTAVVVVNGTDVGAELIRVGLAKPYTGTGLKYDWCQ